MALAVVTGPLAAGALLGGPGGSREADAGAATSAPVSRSATAPTASTTSAGAPASPSPSRAPTGSGSGPPLVQHGSGSIVPVAGSTAVSGPGRLRRCTVAVEAGLGVDPDDVARQVDRTLADPRSWGHGGALGFQRVDSGPAELHVVLASPDTTARLCRPLHVAGTDSCGVGSTVVISSLRWLQGVSAYTGRLPEYRQYVVDHEVGYALGHGHEQCRAPGRPAPVMMQQTAEVGACQPSPWPFP